MLVIVYNSHVYDIGVRSYVAAAADAAVADVAAVDAALVVVVAATAAVAAAAAAADVPAAVAARAPATATRNDSYGSRLFCSDSHPDSHLLLLLTLAW